LVDWYYKNTSDVTNCLFGDSALIVGSSLGFGVQLTDSLIT
jgi:hypothetical protein